MSLNAATIEFLLSKGLSGQDLLEVARRSEMRSDTTATQRKRRQREREMSQRDVTRDKGSDDIDILTSKTPLNGISNEIPAPIEVKPEHVVEVWNDLAAKHGLALVKKLTPERRRKLQTFVRRHSIDDITEAIAAIPRSPFLLGQNQRGWQASFDWFLEPRNLTKLTEGTYVH